MPNTSIPKSANDHTGRGATAVFAVAIAVSALLSLPLVLHAQEDIGGFADTDIGGFVTGDVGGFDDDIVGGFEVTGIGGFQGDIGGFEVMTIGTSESGIGAFGVIAEPVGIGGLGITNIGGFGFESSAGEFGVISVGAGQDAFQFEPVSASFPEVIAVPGLISEVGVAPFFPEAPVGPTAFAETPAVAPTTTVEPTVRVALAHLPPPSAVSLAELPPTGIRGTAGAIIFLVAVCAVSGVLAYALTRRSRLASVRSFFRRTAGGLKRLRPSPLARPVFASW